MTSNGYGKLGKFSSKLYIDWHIHIFIYKGKYADRHLYIHITD